MIKLADISEKGANSEKLAISILPQSDKKIVFKKEKIVDSENIRIKNESESESEFKFKISKINFILLLLISWIIYIKKLSGFKN